VIRDQGFKIQNNEVQGFKPEGAGNISVNLFKERGRLRIRVTVTGGQATHAKMRAGLAAVIMPEEFANAKALQHGVGRMAALLAKQLTKMDQRPRDRGKYLACIDEVDAYNGAVEMLKETMLAARDAGMV
jgi:hypothetical protein